MDHENCTVVVNGKSFEILHCLGHGQCKCKSCEEKGVYNISWTSWFWRVDLASPVMCWDCMKELLTKKSNEFILRESKRDEDAEEGSE